MEDMNLGSKIRQLRKSKGITQEILATAMGVTPQAVSKWESGISYPDMTMIPTIAGYFEVSLDTLFDYDIRKLKNSVQKILSEAESYFFDDPERYDNTIRAALKEYPGNEELLCALLDSYEHSLRNYDRTDLLNEMIDISYQIIGSSKDFVRVCNVKDNLAAAYLRQGKYEKAKEILESLPRKVLLKDDTMAFRLSGDDRLDATHRAQDIHLQDLYIACHQEGEELFLSGAYKQAMDAYTRGLTVLTAFIRKDKSGQDAYRWPGMQTFHWGFLMAQAACLKKLGMVSACEEKLAEARVIVHTAWNDFAERQRYYMDAFDEYLAEYDLAEYIET